MKITTAYKDAEVMTDDDETWEFEFDDDYVYDPNACPDCGAEASTINGITSCSICGYVDNGDYEEEPWDD